MLRGRNQAERLPCLSLKYVHALFSEINRLNADGDNSLMIEPQGLSTVTSGSSGSAA